jgi:hypothetical protein
MPRRELLTPAERATTPFPGEESELIRRYALSRRSMPTSEPIVEPQDRLRIGIQLCYP